MRQPVSGRQSGGGNEQPGGGGGGGGGQPGGGGGQPGGGGERLAATAAELPAAAARVLTNTAAWRRVINIVSTKGRCSIINHPEHNLIKTGTRKTLLACECEQAGAALRSRLLKTARQPAVWRSLTAASCAIARNCASLLEMPKFARQLAVWRQAARRASSLAQLCAPGC